MKRHVPLLLLVVAGFGCNKEAPPPPPPVTTPAPTATTAPAVSVSGLTLGSAVDADKKISSAAAKETFGTKDTIYASVATEGSGHAKLRALWSFVKGEKTAKVDETTIELESAAPAVNEFHIAKPSGWPKGDYKVDIFLGDGTAPALTKTFKVA